MTRAYYNDNNPHAVQHLKNLIIHNLIAPGDVDERSITDVSPNDIRGYTQVHLFAGLGGWSYAARLAGWCDRKPMWSASLPCQPFSVAGKGLGFNDERHLWPHVRNLIKECRPSAFFGEQSAAATEWLKLVRSDMEEMDYAVGAMPIQAACKGARHQRDRTWILAHTERYEQSWEEPRGWEIGRMGRIIEPFPWDEPWESALSRFRALGNGIPRSVGATDAARNAIVPQIAAEVIGAYMEIYG